jgi:hypothetical protein
MALPDLWHFAPFAVTCDKTSLFFIELPTSPLLLSAKSQLVSWDRVLCISGDRLGIAVTKLRWLLLSSHVRRPGLERCDASLNAIDFANFIVHN